MLPPQRRHRMQVGYEKTRFSTILLYLGNNTRSGRSYYHSLTHSLVDLPRWWLATADDHSDIFLLHCARSCDISFSLMYSQPVHSSISCIHCLLGLPWCRSPSMIPSRTVSVVTMERKKTRTRPIELCHFQWPWTTLSDLAKFLSTQKVALPFCDSWASYFRHYC